MCDLPQSYEDGPEAIADLGGPCPRDLTGHPCLRARRRDRRPWAERKAEIWERARQAPTTPYTIVTLWSSRARRAMARAKAT